MAPTHLGVIPAAFMDTTAVPWRMIHERSDAVFRSVPVAGRGAALPDAAVPSTTRAPSWLLLPIWFHETWCALTDRPDPRLDEIVWGQYSLFRYVRLADDLLDRHHDDPRLHLVATLFLVESLAAFERVGALGPDFWTFYHECVRQTATGILEVHALEATPARFGRHHLDLHAKVGAIFKIGGRATCDLHGRREDARWLSELQDQLSISGQIYDDLKDVADDLSTGRFTFAGNSLIAAREGDEIPPEEALRRLAHGFTRPDRAQVIWSELEARADAAGAALGASSPPGLRALVASLRARPTAWRGRLHDALVRSVFGDVIGPQEAEGGGLQASAATIP